MSSHSESWKHEYRRLAPVYEELRGEVVFALRKALDRAQIKTHSLPDG